MTTTPTSDLSTFLGRDPGAERLYDNIQAMLPAVPLSLIKMIAWNTVEDFYLNTGYRRETVYWQMAANVQTVDFNPFDGDWLVAWVGAVSGLTNFKIEPPARLIDMNDGPSLRSGTALLFLKPPAFSATTSFSCLGSDLWSNWFETVLHGVLARLYAMPAKPWSSPQVSTVYFNSYRSGRASARAVAQGGYGAQSGRWQFPYFAQGRRK